MPWQTRTQGKKSHLHFDFHTFPNRLVLTEGQATSAPLRISAPLRLRLPEVPSQPACPRPLPALRRRRFQHPRQEQRSSTRGFPSTAHIQTRFPAQGASAAAPAATRVPTAPRQLSAKLFGPRGPSGAGRPLSGLCPPVARNARRLLRGREPRGAAAAAWQGRGRGDMRGSSVHQRTCPQAAEGALPRCLQGSPQRAKGLAGTPPATAPPRAPVARASAPAPTARMRQRRPAPAAQPGSTRQGSPPCPGRPAPALPAQRRLGARGWRGGGGGGGGAREAAEQRDRPAPPASLQPGPARGRHYL